MSEKIPLPKSVAIRRIIIALIYGVLLVGGLLLGRAVQMGFEDGMSLGSVSTTYVLVLFILLTAIPFIPGIELGIALLVLSGGAMVPWVYAGLVTSLCLSFLAGQLLSAGTLVYCFGVLGLTRSQTLVQKLTQLPRQDRLDLLLQALPGRFAPILLKHRYVALVMILNTPGNTVIGGGGGIALVAGMSGLFSTPGYFAAILFGAAPIPLLFMLFT